MDMFHLPNGLEFDQDDEIIAFYSSEYDMISFHCDDITYVDLWYIVSHIERYKNGDDI